MPGVEGHPVPYIIRIGFSHFGTMRQRGKHTRAQIWPIMSCDGNASKNRVVAGLPRSLTFTREVQGFLNPKELELNVDRLYTAKAMQDPSTIRSTEYYLRGWNPCRLPIFTWYFLPAEQPSDADKMLNGC